MTVLAVTLISLRWGKKVGKQVQQWRYDSEESHRRKLDEQRLSNRVEEKQRLAVEASGSGYWYWDLATDEVQFSQSWATMLGYTSEDMGRNPEGWFNRVHAHYVPELKEALSAHLYGRTDRFQAQYRIQHRDGTYLWVLNRGLAVRNPDGSPVGISGSQIDITQLVDVEKSIVDEAFKDRLTGLPNRQAFLIRLERALADTKKTRMGPLAVMFLDLDRFKVINDTLGHLVGDQLLAAVSSRLRNCVREARGDMVARFGGDEFVVILEELQSKAEALNVAERMLEAMVGPFRIGKHEIRTGVSIGIAVSDPQTERAENLLRNADAAMYHAKLSSREKVAFFNTSMHARVMRLNQLQNDLAEAVKRGELVLHYQPIVSATTGKIEAAEALVRWRHSSGELIGPNEFIPIAEETGLIESIGEWVLRTACAEAVKWDSVGRLPLRISVNVSPLQLVSESLASLVNSIVTESGLRPDLLELEFTETALMSNVPLVSRTIDQLSAFGVSVSLDDFGTGYSSLDQLRRFPFHTVKMDRSLVAGLTTDSRAAAVAKGLINLVHQLGAQVTAEGVETERQLSFLKAQSCDRIQGYYASRPLDANAFAALLEADFNLYRMLEPAKVG
ncbi:MAG: EAL domain-containing protein [Planctomycetota bacterium]|nr:EAL domain-containing protein [Planctomycetota bacterium]